MRGPTLPKELLDKVPQAKTRYKTQKTGRRKVNVGRGRGSDGPVEAAVKSVRPKTDKPATTGILASSKAAGHTSHEATVKSSRISRQVQDALDREDAEIARLEKKLGVRGKKRKAAFDDLLDGIDATVESDETRTWLEQKRLKSEESKLEPEDDTPAESDDPHRVDADDETQSPRPRVREDPYRAPVYVPPSLRHASQDSDGRLNRQIKGQVNRLSDTNIMSIVAAIEELYQTNPRQYVTSGLVDILLAIVTDPGPLNDQFVTLHAGFVAAIFRSRPEFGAHLVEKLVLKPVSSNLMSFLAALYNLDVIACPLVYDYIRQLSDPSEENTAILLRIIKACGPRLRQDDPQALKELLKVSPTSTRHRFMLEAMADLQRAKPAEHLVRTKQMLKSLKRQEPLRMTLADLSNEKRGKWWVVGGVVHDVPTARRTDDDLTSLAKSQGMNTDVRRAIFECVMSATDHRDAHTRLLKLGLKSSQAQEIPRVLVHCVCGETSYNHYYTLVAAHLVGDKKMATTFRYCLYDFLRREDASSREVFNMGRMYASLKSKGLDLKLKADHDSRPSGLLDLLR